MSNIYNESENARGAGCLTPKLLGAPKPSYRGFALFRRSTLNISARYVHTNLIAQDWRSLARFYQQVFGCIPVPPERDFRGSSLDTATGLAGARLTGVHMRLPGYEDAAPT